MRTQPTRCSSCYQLQVSILYLRCIIRPAGHWQVLLRRGFNSLFEMHSLRRQGLRCVVLHAVSILYLRCEEEYTDLGEPKPGDGFNSLFEMQEPDAASLPLT